MKGGEEQKQRGSLRTRGSHVAGALVEFVQVSI
jgi:hypothetical protein